MFKPSFILFGCFCFVYPVLGQQPYLYFNRITSQNGLSHNKVNAIHQDKRGFIWLGTDDGLNRYDGSRFTVFRHSPENPASISGNIITDIVEDASEVLWIASSDGGLTRYDHKLSPGQQFRQYRHVPGDSNSIPINIIYDLVEDKYGYLWLATGGRSVLRFNKKTERFEEPVASGTKTALKMVLDETGVLWVGRQGGSILKINTRTLNYDFDPRYINLYGGLPHATVTALYQDVDKHIWFGSWDRVLYRFNSTSWQEEVFNNNTAAPFPNEEATSFAEDDQGRLWIGGRYMGLTIYDRKQNVFFNYRYDASREGSIADDKVNCIFRDRNGQIWLGTNKGVSVYNPSQHSFIQTFLPSNGSKITIYDLHTEGNGDLWIGTSNGIYIQKKGQWNFIHKPVSFKGEPLAVTKFFSASDGEFYIGTNYSLFVYNKSRNTVSMLPGTEEDPVMRKIIDSRVVSIAEDTIEGHRVLLVAPYGHYMAYYDFVDRKWISRTDSLKNIIADFNLRDNLIRKFYRCTNNELWLATGKMGLGKWNNNSKPNVLWWGNNPIESGSISNNSVYDITEDAKGNFWISTYGGGLNYFDVGEKKFHHIESSNNLLEGLQVDSKGDVWMISNGNLHKYNPETKSYSSFSLPDLEKSGGVNGTIFRGNDGFMFAAGTNYFIRFKPENINDRMGEHAVFFTDFKIFNTSHSDLLLQPLIKLRYKQNYFTFEFSAPAFTSGQMEYSYMLEGWDKEWVEAGNRNFASYSNLDGGDYTFKVRATNKKGSWSNEFASIDVRIVPPFWKTPWFYVLVMLLMAAAVYIAYRYRINELLKRQAIRNKIAQDLHDSVGSTLSSISVYSQVAKIQFERGSNAELKDVLDRIGITSTDMISEMNDIVWTLNPNNDSMEKIFQRMESFARPLLKIKDVQFRFRYDPELLHITLPMENRKNFYLIFKEAINNALKYSGCRNMEINIKQLNQEVELMVKDDGHGFDTEKMKQLAAKSLSGNGMLNMKRRAEEMNGKCWIVSAPGEGTSVFLRFPIP